MKNIFLKPMMFALILSLCAGYFATAKSSAAALSQFKDVPTTHWAYQPIMQGVDKGYISGDPNGTFRPNDPVTVAEFIKMVEMTLTEKDSSGFVWWSDKYMNAAPGWKQSQLNGAVTSFDNGKPWYINYVTTAQNLDLIRDEYVGRYEEKLTRERAAKIINNLDSYFHGTIQREYAMIAGPQLFKDFGKADKYYQEYVADVAIRGIMVGNTQGYFLPKSTITRAEAAKICVLLADADQRSKVKVNTSPATVEDVPQPGFNDMTFVFANAEMKKTYDAMYAHQKSYAGVTNAYTGELGYFADEAARDETFNSTFYFGIDFESKNQSDFGVSFAGNVYNALISIDQSRFNRASNEINYFLSIIFTDNTSQSSVMGTLKSAVSDAQKSKDVNINKTIEGRQVTISKSDNYLYFSISAYKDKK